MSEATTEMRNAEVRAFEVAHAKLRGQGKSANLNRRPERLVRYWASPRGFSKSELPTTG